MGRKWRWRRGKEGGLPDTKVVLPNTKFIKYINIKFIQNEALKIEGCFWKKLIGRFFCLGRKKNRRERWGAQNTGEIVPQINKPEPITEPMHL